MNSGWIEWVCFSCSVKDWTLLTVSMRACACVFVFFSFPGSLMALLPPLVAVIMDLRWLCERAGDVSVTAGGSGYSCRGVWETCVCEIWHWPISHLHYYNVILIIKNWSTTPVIPTHMNIHKLRLSIWDHLTTKIPRSGKILYLIGRYLSHPI